MTRDDALNLVAATDTLNGISEMAEARKIVSVTTPVEVTLVETRGDYSRIRMEGGRYLGSHGWVSSECLYIYFDDRLISMKELD